MGANIKLLYPREAYINLNTDEDIPDWVKCTIVTDFMHDGTKYFVYESMHTEFYGVQATYVKELNEKTEITLEEVARRFGIPVGNLKIKK